MTKLSACLIVKNEERVLDRCLSSIKGVDEIIVVDTGSTDNTPAIAKQYGAKVIVGEYQWNDNFAEARNFALSKCTGDWVLSIDADERLEKDGIQHIKDRIEKEEHETLDVVMFAGSTNFTFPRVFRNNGKIKWEGIWHNHLNVNENNHSDIRIEYFSSPAHQTDSGRCIRMGLKAVKEEPQKPRHKFYLGREYMYEKDYIKAVYWLDRYVKESHWAAEIAYAYYIMAKCYRKLEDIDHAKDCLVRAIAINTNFRSAIEDLAELSGPKNRARWIEFAQLASNDDVLFVHNPLEQQKDYYDKLFSNDSDMSRYENIRKLIGKWAKGRCLDVGCGTAELSRFVKDYHGFDFSGKAIEIADNKNVWQGDAYEAKNYHGNYDTYIATEVMEHLDDYKVLHNIPTGKTIIFSVPSFKDPSHIRTFTEEVARIRYQHFIKFDKVQRFNWVKKWVKGGEETSSYILLIKGTRI